LCFYGKHGTALVIPLAHKKNSFIMKNEKTRSIYKNAQRFADVTKSFIMQGNINRAKRCMLIAENLITTGNKEIQNAIANVYVFSLSSFMEMHRCNIKDLFPKQLQTEYYKQVNSSGI
jgi:hypothetical protein